MPDIVEMPRKLRVTVTIEELDTAKPIELAKSKEFCDGVKTSFVRQAVNFCGDFIRWLFSRLLVLITGR